VHPTRRQHNYPAAGYRGTRAGDSELLRSQITKEAEMKKIALVLPAVTGLAAATVALASPASATPTAAGSAKDTVSTLAAASNKATANQLGSAPLSQCAVITAGPGGDPAPGTSREERHDRVQQALPMPVYVNVTC
jgi:hypothetical protein